MKVNQLEFENIGVKFLVAVYCQGVQVCKWIDWKTQHTTERVLNKNTSLQRHVSKKEIVETTLDRYRASPSPLFQLISCLSPLTKLKGTHNCLETPLWCATRLNNQGARRLRAETPFQPDACCQVLNGGHWTGECFKLYLTCGLMAWVVSQEALKIQGIQVMRMFKAVGLCFLPTRRRFTDVVC